ncbi:MAG: cell cycle protein [Symbiobacteriaceae bacterium]|jgi:tRNA(Ile)-lysidine synthase|nr:cell cycle protein [Symbiobacteriaceae bacterium]
MLEQVRKAIEQYHMLAPGDRVIVSVSGGPDSVALLHLLHRLSAELGLSLHIFHMDHGLRGPESAADAAYVRSLADQFGLPCTVAALPPGALKHQPGSLQANARTARYAALADLAGKTGATKIALGHNRDDQAETVLMRFLRGAGTRGLAGIPPVRTEGPLTYIRPLLSVPRIDIESYCRQHELFARLDQSNLTSAYARNRLRLELLPHLAATYNPAIRENLAQLAAVMRDEDAFLDTLAEESLQRCLVPGEGMALLGSVLHNEPVALARRVVRLAARRVAGPGCDLGLDPVTRVLEAAGRPEGSLQVSLPGGLSVHIEYGICRFLPTVPSDQSPTEAPAWPVAVPGLTLVPALGLEVTVQFQGTPKGPLEAAFVAAHLPGPLAIRGRRPGDRIWPTGMTGSKKVQDLLTDAKVPKRLRDQVPLLVAGDQVLWVIGHRLDRRFLAAPDPSHPALLVRINPLSENIETPCKG